MSVERIVIVGAGQGGLQAAASLRQDGFTGSLALIGAEPGLPYQRPPLSKGFLKTGEAGGLTLRSQASLDKNAIDLIADTRVTGIDGKTREVTTDTKRYGYDHLILATGTHNFRPPSRAWSGRWTSERLRMPACCAGNCNENAGSPSSGAALSVWNSPPSPGRSVTRSPFLKRPQGFWRAPCRPPCRIAF